jgi:hypothetical protein
VTRDYVQEVKDRMTELAELPDRFHQIIALHGHPLVICRTTRINYQGKFVYVWRLSADCDADDTWVNRTDKDPTPAHTPAIEVEAESDEKAIRQFVHQVEALTHLLGKAADRDELLAQAQWYDENPNEREP